MGSDGDGTHIIERAGSEPDATRADKLDEIFELQARLQDHLRLTAVRYKEMGRPGLADLDIRLAEEATKENIYAIHNELTELSDSFNSKAWSRWREDKVDRLNIKVEIVDILHFWTNIAMIWMTADEVMAVFRQKHQENKDRQVRGY